MKIKIKLFLISLFLFFSVSLFADHFQYREIEIQASTTETITGSILTAAAVSTITQITNNDRTASERANNDRLDKNGGDIRCYLDVTAAGAGDTLDVDLIGILGGNRYLIGSFTQATGVSLDTQTFVQPPDLLALDWTIAGDGGETFTFNVQCHRG